MRKTYIIALFLGYFLRAFRIFRITAPLSLYTLHSTLYTLFMVSSAAAQPGLPPDFEHPVDTIYITSTPQGGGKQVIDTLRSLTELKIQVSYIPYNIVITTPDAATFSRYVRIMVVEPGVLAEAGTVGPTIELAMSGCLVLVPKGAPGAEKAPIVKDGLGGQVGMFSRGNWWYCYVKFTKLGQRFTCNPTNEYNKDQWFHPAQNTVIIMGPKREVTIQTQFK